MKIGDAARHGFFSFSLSSLFTRGVKAAVKLFCECVADKVFHFPTNSKCKHIPRSDLKTRRSRGVLQDNRSINNRSSTGFMLSRFPGGDNETAISIHRKMLPIQRNRGVCHSFAQPSSSSGIIKLTKELSYFHFLRCDFHVLLLVSGDKHKSWLGFHCDQNNENEQLWPFYCTFCCWL